MFAHGRLYAAWLRGQFDSPGGSRDSIPLPVSLQHMLRDSSGGRTSGEVVMSMIEEGQ